jgi:hypothetical protein
MRIRVLPYKRGSKSAKAITEAVGGLRLKLRGSRFNPRDSDMLINWGNSVGIPNIENTRFLNPPHLVENVSDKRIFFQRMHWCAPDAVPECWSYADAIPEDAFPIVCRTILNGHSGQGIVIANNRSELVPAPLYVKYIKKESEFRVHVGKGAGLVSDFPIIATQRKGRRRDVPDEEVNWQIRNHDNGFVFVRNDIFVPDKVVSVAQRALSASELDFGAVDVVYNNRENRAYVLEINSAPGVEGQTVQDYANYFKEII